MAQIPLVENQLLMLNNTKLILHELLLLTPFHLPFFLIHCAVYKMLRGLKKKKLFNMRIKPVYVQISWLGVEEGLVPVMDTDGCLTYFEHFMPCKS